MNENENVASDHESSFSEETLKLAQCLMPVPPSTKLRQFVRCPGLPLLLEFEQAQFPTNRAATG
jgi:hypothetical protein